MPDMTLLACHRCDALQRVRLPGPGKTVICTCCGAQLFRRPKGGLDRPIALMSGALIFFLVANLFPLVSLEIGGLEMQTTLLGTSAALWQHGSMSVATVVFLVTFLVPLLIMVTTLHVLVSIRFRLFLPYTRKFLWLLSHLHPWEMGDVFLVSMLVALVKLLGIAKVIVDDGFYALVAAVVLAIAARASIETWLLWRSLDREEAAVLRTPQRRLAGEGAS